MGKGKGAFQGIPPRLRRLVRFNRLDAITFLDAIHVELDFLADFPTEQRLRHRAQVADQALFDVEIPGPQYRIGFRMLRVEIRDADFRADIHRISFGTKIPRHQNSGQFQ